MFYYNIIIKNFLKKALIIKGVNKWIRFMIFPLEFQKHSFINSYPHFIHTLILLIYKELSIN